MTQRKPSRGLDGALVKLFRGGDYELTVTGRTEVGPHYLRLHFHAPELLAAARLHPTMWVRGWFPDGDRAHQRGYTLVNPDRQTGTVDIDFALHDGIATRWACDAAPGDVLEVTVLGSSFALPSPSPAGYLIAGDTASLPAINSLLDAIGDIPAWVFLEAPHDEDRDLPVQVAPDADVEVIWVDRVDDGRALVETITAAAFDASDHFAWVACDTRTTRAVTKVFREDYAVPRTAIKSQAYWSA